MALGFELLPLQVPLIVVQLKRQQQFRTAEIRRFQNRKLRALVRHSYDNVPYYHYLLKKANLRPDDVKTVDDLWKVPISKKKDICYSPKAYVTAKNMNLTKCWTGVTSGTTGVPVRVYRERKVKLFTRWANYLWQMECGQRMRDRQVEIAGRAFLPRSIPRYHVPYRVPFLFQPFKTKCVSSLIHPKAQIEQIRQFKANVLHTFPSVLAILIKEVEESGIDLKLKLIFTSGEFLDNHTRELARKRFGADLFDGYGSSEVGGTCLECFTHNGYHVLSDLVLVEMVRGSELVSPGEEGEITVTNLNNHVMPFIRYNLEDVGVLMENPCPCGNSRPLMRLSYGKGQEFVNLVDGRVIPGELLIYEFRDIDGVKQFQVTQEKIDEFTVRIIRGKDFKQTTIPRVRQRLACILGDVRIEVSLVNVIPREKSGKFRPFISKIPSQTEVK